MQQEGSKVTIIIFKFLRNFKQQIGQKFAFFRSNSECAEEVTGAVRECEVTIFRSRNRLNVRESQCGSDVVTR